MSTPTFQLTGKVIAVTGGASGIGLETVKLLASLGAKVSVADKSKDGLDAAAKDLKEAGHGDILTTVLDVRDRPAVEKWIEETVKWGGKLDGACNLAGVVGKSIGMKDGSIELLSSEEWDFILDINLKGVMHCLSAELKHMSDNGAIVNASSVMGVAGAPNNAAYSASKHGVIGLTRCAAHEVGARGIRVNAICPGGIDTPMLRASIENVKKGDGANRKIPLGRLGKSVEVAGLCAYLLGDLGTYVNGSVIGVDGGWNA